MVAMELIVSIDLSWEKCKLEISAFSLGIIEFSFLQKCLFNSSPHFIRLS